jgi:probable F420-dependent oxidoreductase
MVGFALDLTIWPWEYRSFDGIVEIASLAERIGLDSLWMSDHLMYTTPGKGSLEVFSALAAVAARTKKITVGTKVVCAPLRHPGLLAKMGTTLDIVSGGRFVLGIGAGWHKTEFEAFGFPFERRFSRMREAVEIVRELWTKSVVDFDGEFYCVHGAVSLPKPVQKPHPPIWIGSQGPRMLRLTAELGDGWIITNQNAEEYRRKLNLIGEHARKVGRGIGEIEASYYAYSSIASSSEEARMHAEEHILPERRRVLGPELSLEDVEGMCIIGDPDEWISRIEEYVRAGASHIIAKIVPLNPSTVRLYGERVTPYFEKIG